MEKLKRGNLRADELRRQKKSKKTKTRITIILIITIVVTIIIAIYISYKKQKPYSSFDTVHTAELSNTAGSTYISYKSGVLKITRDGVEAMNADGKVLWNVSYNMKDPISAVCGNYAAIADRGGKTLIIINGHGEKNEITTEYSIEQVEVAMQGVTAVLTSNVGENYIDLYSFDSQNKLATMNTNTEKHGFPVEIALSQDGKKMATSYIAIDGDAIKNWVTFYSFSDYAKNLAENTAGSVSFENIVPEIRFLTNDLICIYKDNGFILYKMKELPEVVAIEDINGEIESTFSNNSMLGFIVRDKETGNKKLTIYSYSGKKELEENIQVDYEKVVMTEKVLVFYSQLSSEFYSLKGKYLFSNTFTKNINYISATDDANQLLLISDVDIDRVQLKGTKED